MVKIDALVFGYRRITVSPDDLSEFTGILIRAHIPSVINNSGTITVRERDFEKIKGLIAGRIDFSYSEPLGIYGKWKRMSHKIPILISLCLSILMIVLLSNIIWDVRVDGNEKLTDSEIILELSECGLGIGDFWRLVDRSKIETSFLDKVEEVSWININRRGSVAYIKIIERDNAESEKEQNNYPSNLVANTDCVIEEITVKRGIAVVKPGDTVKRGDILVIGALPQESGGGWCEAEATVIGRIYDTVSVSVGRNYENKVTVNKRLYSCTVKIFNFSLNIFKIYRNLPDECDIIENEIKCSLFDRCKLPISISLKHIPEYANESGVYTDEELVSIASDRLMSLMASRLEMADLLKIKTIGDFTEEGYVISTNVVYLSDVSERVKLEIIK